jgi:putative chitinase
MPVKMTEAHVRRLFPRAREDYVRALADGGRLLDAAGVTESKLRLAHFLAQLDAETGGLTITEESGNYTAARLLEVFPTHFTRAEAARYAHKPKAILSHAYARHDLGNGGEMSGDGWRYRGRGLTQLTGKYNYRIASKVTGVDLVANPDAASDGRLSLMISLDEWARGNCNHYADQDGILEISRWINCGNAHSTVVPNGMAHRQEALARIKAVMRDMRETVAPVTAAQPEDLPEQVRATPAAAETVTGLRNAGDGQIHLMDRLQAIGAFLGFGGAMAGTAQATTLPSIISGVRQFYEPLVGDLQWLIQAWPALIVVGGIVAYVAVRAKRNHVERESNADGGMVDCADAVA